MKVPGLRSLRERSGLTQRELAEVAGVARRSIAGWESGERIRPGSAGRLAGALGVSISDLCEERISATIQLSDSPEDEHTGQVLAMLRRYEDMAQRREYFDFSAADLKRVSGSIATESIYGAAQAVDRGDHAVAAEILGRTTRVLDWLQELATALARSEATALATIKEPIDTFLRDWSAFASTGGEHPREPDARSRRERAENDG
jgi:transcriptional regulator with XRE-family HTH domain